MSLFSKFILDDNFEFRDRLAQEGLSVLVKGKSVRLLATVDHVNATLLWNQVNILQISYYRGFTDLNNLFSRN